MYAQHARGREGATSGVPINYSGNAFRYPPPTAVHGVPPRETRTDNGYEVPCEPPAQASDVGEESVRAMEECLTEEAPSRQDVAGVGNDKGALLPSLLRGVGQEELLLLGLLLLLGGESEGGGLPLYLLLLLLFG